MYVAMFTRETAHQRNARSVTHLLRSSQYRLATELGLQSM